MQATGSAVSSLRVIGIGPQIGYVFPIGTEHQGYLNFKGYKEFDASHRPEGWNLWLTFAITPAAEQEAAAKKAMITCGRVSGCVAVCLRRIFVFPVHVPDHAPASACSPACLRLPPFRLRDARTLRRHRMQRRGR